MSRKRKIIAASICLIVLAGAAIFVWLNSSNQGTISSPKTLETTKAGPVTDKTFQGKYITFTYWSSYLSRTLSATGNDLELYKLSADTIYEKNLVVAVSTLPQGGLDQNSAYLLRKTRTDLYKDSQLQFNGGTASLWTRNDNQEITAFMQQGSRVAMLSFVQSDTDDNDLQKEVEAVIRSFAWK